RNLWKLTMGVIRLAKIAVIAVLAVFALIVAYDNVLAYNSNYQFVRHVLSMDTIFPDSALRSRAIDSETMWRAACALIIAIEASTGFLLALGAVVLLGRLRASAKLFNHAKLWAVAGLTLGFCLWFLGFRVDSEYHQAWTARCLALIEGQRHAVVT